jgi:hypothetical protein
MEPDLCHNGRRVFNVNDGLSNVGLSPFFGFDGIEGVDFAGSASQVGAARQ